MKKQTLESWIIEALTDDEKTGGCSVLALMHASGGVEKELHSVRLGNKQWTERDLAEMFRNKAQSYCQELPGVHFFVVLAFYGESTEPQARHPFRLQGELELGDLGTEAPDDRGIRQQNMRHQEAVLMTGYKMMALSSDNQNQMMGMLLKELIATRQQNGQLLEGLQSALLQKAQDVHAFRIEEMKLQHTNMLWEKGMNYLPSAANKLLGKEVFPTSTVDASLMEMVAKDLIANPDKIPVLQGTFSPDVWAAIVNRLHGIMSEKKKAEELAARVTKDGAADAEGA